MRKSRILRLLLFCLLSFALQQVTAQTKSISGTVLDEKNNPLQGASVIVKGSTSGTTTDADGRFSITVPASASILVISNIGYNNQEISITGKNSITVQLTSASSTLTDVVVVGYGTTRKKDLTGAVATLSNKDLNQGPITSPLQQIAGRAAGVNVSQIGNEPGTGPSVRIRGITSLIGGNDPLVVVDGIQGNMDLLNQVPPSEIESVDILKDASATAIYGSRGAPGVILVTTKKGKAGRTTVEYNATASIDMIPKKLDLLNASEWGEQAQKWNVPASANKGGNTDWFDLLTRKGNTQNHTLSFGGGSSGFNYRASLTALLQNGIVINSNFKNYIGRIQATQKALDDKLTLSFNLNNGVVNVDGSPQSIGRAAFTSNLISNTYVTRPTDPVYASDGSYFTDPNVFQYINPYAVAETVVNERKTNNLFGSLRADLQLLKGLSAGWFGSWRKTDMNSGYYLPAASTVANAIDNKGVANITTNRQDERLMDITLNYKKDLKNQSLEALLGYEWQNLIYNGNFTQAKGFFNDIAAYNALQLGDISRVQPGDLTSYKNDRTIVSFFGRINYSLFNRYLLTLSLRRDGSSVFGPNHQWGNFPSASLAWRVTDESFMKNQKVFNDLKLRVGYGITGNQQGLTPQRSLQLVGGSGVAYFGGAIVTNFAVTQNANSDLRWETRYQANAGLDFSMVDRRLNGSVDIYKATTKNLLFNYSVPQPPYPFGTITANVGSLLNEGLELGLNYQVIRTKNTTLTLGGNLSLLRNKVLELSGSINGVPLNTDTISWGPNAYLIKGERIGTFNILQHSGKDAANAETVVDRDRNGIIDQGNRSKDRVISGSALPTYTYAFTPSFTYKNLDVSMIWRGSGGNKIYNSLKASLSYMENIGKSNVLTSAIPLGIYTSKYGSDLWLENGSFLRFDNLTMGYRFNMDGIKYINGLRVSLTANNIAVFTKYSGLDPELNVSGGDGFGGDNGIYPRTRSIAVGLNVIFK